MKKIALLLVILTLLCVVSACDKVGDAPSATEAPATSSPVSETTAAAEGDEDDFFDTARSHLPTEAEVLQVKAGMSFYAVVDLIGKPHRFAYRPDFSSSGMYKDMVYAWETVEGKSYGILFMEDEASVKMSELSLKEYHRYTIAREDPRPDYTEPQHYTYKEEHDENGRKSKKITYLNDGYVGETQYFYNESGKMVKELYLKKDGEVTYTTIYSYYDNGTHKQTRSCWGDSEVLRYLHETFEDGSTNTERYNENGVIYEKTERSENGSIFYTYHDNGSVYEKYEYNSNGSNKCEYQYDTEGNLIFEKIYH